MRPEERRLDWAHPPADAEPLGLWAALHDAALRSLSFDRDSRVCTICLDVDHLDVEVEFRIAHVLALRTNRWTFVESRGDRPIGIEESVPWEWAATEIAQETQDVSNAAFLQDEGEVAFRFEGLVGETFYRIEVRGERLDVEGDVRSIEELVARGKAYWDAFGRSPR